MNLPDLAFDILGEGAATVSLGLNWTFGGVTGFVAGFSSFAFPLVVVDGLWSVPLVVDDGATVRLLSCGLGCSGCSSLFCWKVFAIVVIGLFSLVGVTVTGVDETTIPLSVEL